jgi:hypothetical protein
MDSTILIFTAVLGREIKTRGAPHPTSLQFSSWSGDSQVHSLGSTNRSGPSPVVLGSFGEGMALAQKTWGGVARCLD